MAKRFIFPEVAAAPGSSQLTETINLEYSQRDGLWVVEEHIVPVHFPTIRLQRELTKAIDKGLETLKGRLINIYM